MKPQTNTNKHELKIKEGKVNMNLLYKEESYKIKQACIEVKNNLGTGFLEKVYENALKYELEINGFIVKQQCKINVFYKNKNVGEYIPDLIINDCIIIELKAVNQMDNIMKAQLINYLKATGYKLGFLINFSNKYNSFEFERIIYDKVNKKKVSVS